MTKKDNSLALLPNGFVDLLPPFAQSEANSIQILMDKFLSFGYQRIKPPLLEFEDSLLAHGPGEHLSSDTFRVMDPVTHRMLGVRSDSTAQISRIVSSRMSNEPRPLRLAYANDVLRTRGSQMRTERQFTQVGCEFIGGETCVQSDVEICILSILGLKELGISDITLDLTIPNFVSRMLSCGDNVDVIKKAVAQRDVDALRSMSCSKAHMIAQVINSSGSYSKALDVLSKLDVGDDLRANIAYLKDICTKVESALSDLNINDINLSIDAVEQGKFEYHKNLGFTLFCAQIRGELGSGGCYDVRFGSSEDTEVAKGFTLYMDSIAQVKAMQDQSEAVAQNKIFVDADQPWSVISSLQSQGWVVIRGANDKDSLSLCAQCTHIYKNEEIIELN